MNTHVAVAPILAVRSINDGDPFTRVTEFFAFRESEGSYSMSVVTIFFMDPVCEKDKLDSMTRCGAKRASTRIACRIPKEQHELDILWCISV